MNTKTQSLADLYQTDPRKACRLALRRTAALPDRDRLEAIDKLLGTYGTEAIEGEWQNGYWCSIQAAYCNAGDTYATTVIHCRDRGFHVSDVGTYVERLEASAQA